MNIEGNKAILSEYKKQISPNLKEKSPAKKSTPRDDRLNDGESQQ
jgi:hypothetical protein